jgi:Tfp pilus assembly protein PilF
MPSRLTTLGFAAVLGLLVIAVYYPVVGHEFVSLDDPTYYLKNPNLDGRFGVDDVIGAFAHPYFANWTPLTSISIAFDNALYGTTPTGFLVTNVLLHAAAALLLFLTLRRMTGEVGPAVFVAAVFAVHPLHVESVAWAAERKDVLMGAAWMGTLLAYALYRERPSAGRYTVMFGCAVAAMLSKPAAVTLPFALLLLDYWPAKRFGLGLSNLSERLPLLRAAFVEKIPLFALSTLTSLMALHSQTSAGAHRNILVSFSQRLMNAALSYGTYVVDSVWPSGLAAHYPYEVEALFGPAAIVSAVAVVATTVAVIRLAGTRPYLLVGWFWFLGVLIPMIGAIQVGTQARADRYMYVAQIGLAIMLTYAVAHPMGDRPGLRRAAGISAALVIAVLAFAAHGQVGHWRDTEHLFVHALDVTRDNTFAHTALGSEYRKRGELALAERHFLEALRIQPDSGDARSDLGILRIDQQRFSEARIELRRALEVGAETAKVKTALGLTAERSGDHASAVTLYREALRSDPNRLEALNNLAWLLATTHQSSVRNPEEAVVLAERAGSWSRHNASVLDTLAAAYAAAGRPKAAVETQIQAVNRVADDNPALRRDLERRLVQYRAQARESGGQ